MQPKSLSATALHVFEQCPARYKAEHIDRSKGFGGTAATLGSTVHGALEMFVKACYIDNTHEPSENLLLEFLKLSYVSTFGTTNYETVEYMEGYEMMVNWYKRTIVKDEYFKNIVKVVSCEVKTFFEVPTSIGPIPFNYIWDRFDQTAEKKFKVVDYKSNRWAIRPEDLKKKIQARCYGLAAAIQLKSQSIEYDKIWVEFDLLRHGPVGTVFTYEDNAATWKFLKESAEEIIATQTEDAAGNPIPVPEKLNPECLFCVRKAGCEALRKNITVGGLHSIATIEEAIDIRAQVEWQKKGLESLLKDLDAKILTEARERDMEQFESDLNRLTIGVSTRRAVDAERVEQAIGPKLFAKYGSNSITLANVEKLLKGKELTPEQKANLRSLIYTTTGEPRVKVEPKNPIDED
jgi:hypothetical protein